MKHVTNKDWTDAVRERMLSDGTALSSAGWAAVERRVRRSAALRHGGLVAAVLLPVIALLLWSPWRQAATPPAAPAPRLAESSGSVPPEPPASLRSGPLAATSPSNFIPGPASVIPDVIGDLPLAACPADNGVPADMDETAPSVAEEASPSFSGADSHHSPALTGEAEEGIPIRAWDEGKTARQRPRLALRVHAATAVRGVSVAGGMLPLTVMKQITEEGHWIEVGSAVSNGHDPSGAGDKVMVYVPSETKWVSETVQTPQAPVFPMAVGISLDVPISRHWALTTGLDYCQRPGNSVYNNQPQSLVVHYFGVPVEIHCLFWPESRFRVFAGAGVKVEKSLFVTGGEPLQDPFLFSANLQAGADVRILPGIRLYVAPVLSQFLNKSAYNNTWDTNPHVSLRMGMSFEL